MSEEDHCSTIPIPVDCLVEMGSAWKYGHSKSLAIIRSTSAIISTLSSLILMRMIFSSKQRLSTTYHRLLIGMSVGDVLYSLCIATFHSMLPSDMNYAVWNARGNEASCTANGFIQNAGGFLTLFYSCSLNLYFLTSVRYKKTDRYIRTKVEPSLHLVPIVLSIVISITFLVNDNFNNIGAWDCLSSPTYYPPHCIGYEDGEVPEGFEIPCGRGHGEQFFLMVMPLLIFAPPIVIGGSLFMLYRSVSKQERSNRLYGEQSIRQRLSSTSQNSHQSVRSSVASIVRSISSLRRNSPTRRNQSNSRAVLNKAIGYSLSYFMAWLWVIVGYILVNAGVKAHNMPLFIVYMINIFNPLEGFFNLCIFMHPKVMSTKRSRNISQLEAFRVVLWSGLGISFCNTQRDTDKPSDETPGQVPGTRDPNSTSGRPISHSDSTARSDSNITNGKSVSRSLHEREFSQSDRLKNSTIEDGTEVQETSHNSDLPQRGKSSVSWKADLIEGVEEDDNHATRVDPVEYPTGV